MNNVLLINKCNPDERHNEILSLTVIIGEMHKQTTCDRVVAALEKMEFIDISKLILKYNGIVVDVNVENIPKLLLSLLNNDLKIYSVYELYE
ncbi:hypothetical protein [Microaceticoccus formicicus]|uniref:hypothetical protein n=1 Tax=Microaceticoccus formicicus TaxID=3118105 RepID=UPI003CCFFB9A|nr:hypothetical protein VZL98_03655 [Peptoniphilaceae bacterium AMB_02]